MRVHDRGETREVFVVLSPKYFGVRQVGSPEWSGLSGYFEIVARWAGKIWGVASARTRVEAFTKIEEVAYHPLAPKLREVQSELTPVSRPELYPDPVILGPDHTFTTLKGLGPS